MDTQDSIPNGPQEVKTKTMAERRHQLSERLEESVSSFLLLLLLSFADDDEITGAVVEDSDDDDEDGDEVLDIFLRIFNGVS